MQMTVPFHYSTTFVLDKSHFSETFDASVPPIEGVKPYTKAILIALFGVVLLYGTPVSGYLAWFIICLGAVEALSVKFRKAWWLWRQLLSRSANSPVELKMDESGIYWQSAYVNNQLRWDELNRIESTEAGWLLHSQAGRTYLSNRCLNDEALAFLQRQSTR